MHKRLATIAFLTLCLSPVYGYAQPVERDRISELTRIDRDYLERQRDAVDDLARRRLGRQLRGEKRNDLEVLQLLLDRHAVDPSDTSTLQAMGIVMGDRLGDELGLHWVIYEDRLGRTRALRYRDGDALLYPVTMISRRIEVGARADVAAIYAKAAAAIRSELPPRPFQY
ncbi:MAG: DUF3806 domain-containing protein [Pseudomonadota bacterium]